MIRERAITSLIGQVGWGSATGITLDSTNSKSDSGFLFEDSAPFVSIDNVLALTETILTSESDKNAYLTKLQKSVIRDLLSKCLPESKLLESKTLYKNEQSFKNVFDVSGDFIGVEFTPCDNTKVVTELQNIKLSFDKSITLPIYIYHTDTIEEVKKVDCVIVANQATQVAINYVMDKPGTYKIGYKVSEMQGAKPYIRDFELSNIACYSTFAHLEFYSYSFDGSRLDITNKVAIEQPFGINLDFDSYIDYSDLVERNKSIFSRAIQLQMSENVLNAAKVSERLNLSQKTIARSKEDINLMLYGNPAIGLEGINGKLSKEIERITEALINKPLIKRDTWG